METHTKLNFSRNEEYAFKKGYKVTPEGLLIGLKGKPSTNYDKYGYLRIGAKKNGKLIIIFAHRLQAYQKYGNKIYQKNILVRHLDGNKKNNASYNIAIGTVKDNYKDIPHIERKRNNIKQGLSQRKYNYKEIKEYHKKFSQKKTLEKFNISNPSTLWYILNK